MGPVVTSDLEEIAQQELGRISLGIKPSGLLHLGNTMALFHGVMLLSKDPGAYLDLNIMDLDFDLQRGRDFIPYINRKDPFGCHDGAGYHTAGEARHAANDMAAYFGVSPERIRIAQFSPLTENAEFRDVMRGLFLTEDGRKLLKRTVLPTPSANVSSMLSPICPDCGHSSTKRPRISYADGNLKATCYNEECETATYELNMSDAKKVNFFYLIDPLRDIIPDSSGNRAAVHIFGGDYMVFYGTKKIPKAERMHTLLSSFTDAPPSIFITPLLTYGGEKLSKSLANGYMVSQLRETNPDWVERMHALLQDKKNASSIDMAGALDYFRQPVPVSPR